MLLVLLGVFGEPLMSSLHRNSPSSGENTSSEMAMETRDRSWLRNADIATNCVYGLSLLTAAAFLFLPLVNFLHPSPWHRWMNGLHGLAAMLATVIVAYAGHLAFPLLRGKSTILPQIRTLSFWASTLAFLAICSGMWSYTRYRAPINGARAWLKEHTPLVHYLYMEYHEFTVLFTIPIGVACTWIAWRYGDRILHNKNRTVLSIVAVGLMAMMFFGIGGFISGLGVAKIHGL